MKIKERWIKHLRNNKLSYISHLKFAWKISLDTLLISLYLLIHGLFPCFFESAASDKIQILHDALKNRNTNDDT